MCVKLIHPCVLVSEEPAHLWREKEKIIRKILFLP